MLPALFDRRNGNDYCTVLTRENEAGPVDDGVANSEWRFELVGEREYAGPISTVEGQEAARFLPRALPAARLKRLMRRTPIRPLIQRSEPPTSMRGFDPYIAIGNVIGSRSVESVLTDWALLHPAMLDLKLRYQQS